jgi:hypothetical protein
VAKPINVETRFLRATTSENCSSVVSKFEKEKTAISDKICPAMALHCTTDNYDLAFAITFIVL